MDTSVGLIGVGMMGGAMARNLIGRGFRVVGCDIAASALSALRAAGGEIADSPKALLQTVDRAIISLPTVAAFREVMFGASGVVAADAKDRILIECSTLPLALKQEAHEALRASGKTLLDCPVSGTGAQAVRGDLVVLGSGDSAAFERCGDIFAAISKAHHYLGPFGAGIKMKLVANHLVHCHNVAAAEAIVLATKAGIDLELMLRVLADSAGGSKMLEVRGPLMIGRRYDQRSAQIKTYMKDMAIISEFARELACPLPMFKAGLELYVAALADGRAEEEPAAVHAVLEALAGIRSQRVTA